MRKESGTMATFDETSRGGKTGKQWKQKFKSDYTRDFPCIKNSRKGNFNAYCSVCVIAISVSNTVDGTILSDTSKRGNTNRMQILQPIHNCLTFFSMLQGLTRS